MASFFGETVFPPSRAFLDDKDEYEVIDSEPCLKLHVRWVKNKPTHMRKFILMEGDSLISFMQQYLLYKLEEACIIENENGTKVSTIYHQTDKDIYLCIILPGFDIKVAGKFIKEISDLLLGANSIISIVCNHVSRFKSTNVPEIPSFLRILVTRKAHDITELDRNIKSLEQPNLIFGVGAGVLSYSELRQMSAKLYILYIDSLAMDSKCAEPILQVLNNEMHCELQPKFVDNFFSKGNLYM
ncbi:proteasome assembly chaperone 1 [Linepithema humile]|uniref:proteasome assembly chaperone 1 n=1 Tax=Linepithema humile TaxID=83485 RepID=UPI0006236888|nr:PREDICTED: proteasome assembly chaperone 1 [Linepithema humile]